MNYETASMVFIGTGTILFGSILYIKRVHLLLALCLATLSILWVIYAMSEWLPTFPTQWGWMGILVTSIGILGGVNILLKGTHSNPIRKGDIKGFDNQLE